jgi:hypothetical protein
MAKTVRSVHRRKAHTVTRNGKTFRREESIIHRDSKGRNINAKPKKALTNSQKWAKVRHTAAISSCAFTIYAVSTVASTSFAVVSGVSTALLVEIFGHKYGRTKSRGRPIKSAKRTFLNDRKRWRKSKKRAKKTIKVSQRISHGIGQIFS